MENKPADTKPEEKSQEAEQKPAAEQPAQPATESTQPTDGTPPASPPPPVQPPSQTQQPTTPSTPPKPEQQKTDKGGNKVWSFFFALLMFLIGIGLGYLLTTQFPTNAKKEAVKPEQKSEDIALPKDAVQIQSCVTGKGALHVRTEDLPVGPYYMVSGGKVIGLEFVLTQNELKQGKVFGQISGLKAKIEQLATGAYPDNYTYVDAFVVKKEVTDAIKCPGTPQSPVASPSAALSSAPTPTAIVTVAPTQATSQVQGPPVQPTAADAAATQ